MNIYQYQIKLRQIIAATQRFLLVTCYGNYLKIRLRLQQAFQAVGHQALIFDDEYVQLFFHGKKLIKKIFRALRGTLAISVLPVGEERIVNFPSTLASSSLSFMLCNPRPVFPSNLYLLGSKPTPSSLISRVT